jgi:glycerol-3-phosphate dehydrogenase
MQNFDHNISFLAKNAIFSAKNCRKSQKIVIITSTPGDVQFVINKATVFYIGATVQRSFGALWNVQPVSRELR